MKLSIENFEFEQTISVKKATFDLRVVYTEEKWELFRNLGYFEKENSKWVGMPRFKRAEKWIALYERPNLKELTDAALKEVQNLEPKN